MTKFRKNPVVIDAVPCTEALRAASDSWHDLPDWLEDAYELGKVIFGADEVHVQTLEGWVIAAVDDWILRGTAGEIYPCKDAIFSQTHTAVE